MSYFAKKRHERLVKIVNYVEKHEIKNYDNLVDEVIASFGVTPIKAREYVDTLIRIGVLRFVGENKRAVVKDGRKLEAMKE